MNKKQAGLFGLKKTNRDFTRKEAWGKNQFNSSFPAALCCYLEYKKIEANYLLIKDGVFTTSTIPIKEVFNISAVNDEIYFAFESQHTPYQKYIVGTLPRTDLVIQKESSGECLSALEVKLTAIPDNTTCQLTEDRYGSEIVVRPDTIVYLACSIASSLNASFHDLLPKIEISDWSDPKYVLDKIDLIINAINDLAKQLESSQEAFLLQPIWKTNGKSPELSKNCLDVFIWSNAGFANFISEISDKNLNANSITRQTRSAVWLFKMLLDIKNQGKFNHSQIIDGLSLNTKNDKAFASSGLLTNKYMKCSRLAKPVIEKSEIKNIILGGGQNLLSPERRFDSIIYNSPEIFK